MKTSLLLALIFLISAAFLGSALAVPPGKIVEFAGGSEGKVVFNGDKHSGFKCTECHTNPQLFQMQKGADNIKMKNIHSEKYCGYCHNGKKAFNSDQCAKCHKKKVIEGC